GNFDDPRVDFVGDELNSSFHFGVDISAPDYAPVYAVAAGTASRHADYVDVLTSGGRDFGYWHVTPAVENRQSVARGDLLGYVQRGWGHVHFAENLNGVYLNPLRAPPERALQPRLRPRDEAEPRGPAGPLRLLPQGRLVEREAPGRVVPAPGRRLGHPREQRLRDAAVHGRERQAVTTLGTERE